METMMAGELALRQVSLRHLGAPRLFPGILVAPEMRGKLSFVVRLSQTEEFLFGLFEEQRGDTVADVRLRFAVRPTPEPVLVPFDRSGVLFVPPPFLEPPGEPGLLRLWLHSGQLLQVRFGADETMALHDENRVLVDAAQEWPTALLVELLETLAAWLRTRRSGTPRPFVVPTGTILGRLLHQVIDALQRILDNFDGEPADRDTRALDAELTAIHPAFGAGYHLQTLLAQLLVQLDAHGDLVTDLADPDWQQFDIAVRVVPNAGRHDVQLAMHPPDFLTAGAYHGSFLTAIRAPAVTAELARALDRPDLDEAAFAEYLHDPWQDRASLFVRIRRDDVDLVLLHGRLRGEATRLLYEMRFEVTPYPEVHVRRVTDIRLLAAAVGAQSWDDRASSEPGQRYFRRFLRALRVWQTGMLLATAT